MNYVDFASPKSVITTLVWWEGKLFVGCADKLIKGKFSKELANLHELRFMRIASLANLPHHNIFSSTHLYACCAAKENMICLSTQNYRDEDEGYRELYMVYKGRVTRVMETGCFVQLNDFKGKEGLVHISQMATMRIGNAKDVVKRDQEVFVKVISMSGQKLSLSMRDFDQHSDKDSLPLKKSSDEDCFRTNPSGSRDDPQTRTGLSGIRITDEDVAPSRRPLKRLSSPEKWETKQLIASGVMDLKDYPMFDEEGDRMLYQEEGPEEELEIELNEDEPAFLNGQTRYSIDMSPVKIFKNPEGSLSRAAALRYALIK